ncbi:nuclear intron maturase 1, mitochondrial [Rhododendron vialii]|uniref:nuclear intron maturase 1, mitochondrial n=1 Tax=Rhododendron vialii TaxID=182163 RepID=UPI00265F98C3|nr:nuclear intron maturase 1, mitochondrial [Rhododendron vialii]XP_058196148.1 nuclear intron maturase 1, mitochondrial [Rhododendron vialii]XP_058196149.1 nuclear intron maturase 1, mitochondrial [Rhododendron vialii]XP_058196150.1 nuclear intron maturase 1, mitochondrial [Rhododendron vialii]XP_058196152.1 nuclear intron maturase 1, mitochondrial [Rhododendron vialii]XP_058196153.1 nuclear intron maturase 1, mitochondrial [Rhododendron vialii]XP_058196154.1 nuclear intron maturase 1, mitoc
MTLRNSIKHLRRITSSPTQPPPHRRRHNSNQEPPPPHHHPDPHSLLNQDPIQLLSSLWIKCQTHPTKPFPNLTGFLSNLDLWVLSYQRASAHLTASFPPKSSLPSHTLLSLLSLQNAVVKGRFQWNSPTQLHILSPNPAKLLSPSFFQDRVVQEVLLMILEPVFEPRFSPRSHGFRPGRNPHTAIRTIRSGFAGYLWFLKGDVSGMFEHVDVNVVMGCVGKAVKDKKVLGLIKGAFRAPMNDNGGARCSSGGKEEFGKKRKKKKTGSSKKKILNADEPKLDPYWLRIFDSFAPEEAFKVPNYGCCGILSPLLANVCLNELDHMMEEKLVEFFRPSKLDSIWKSSLDDGSHNPAWPEFVPSSGEDRTRKMDYLRYGGHFLVGIRGPREEALRIRKEIIDFCESKYGLSLDNSKVEIEHISRGIQFLDHIICLRVIHPTLRYTATGGEIVSKKGVGTLLSVTASLQRCIRQFRQLELIKGDKDPEPLPCTPMLYSGQAHTNEQMNKFLETMADWYRYADNRKKVVAFFAYVIRGSLAKLYAARYRLKSRAKVYKIASRDLSNPLRVSNKSSVPEYSDLLSMGLVDKIEGVQFSRMSLIPSCDYTPLPRNWVPNHERVLHEYIRLQDPKFFCALHRSIKQEALSVPQDEISEILWDCKTLGVHRLLSNPK